MTRAARGALLLAALASGLAEVLELDPTPTHVAAARNMRALNASLNARLTGVRAETRGFANDLEWHSKNGVELVRCCSIKPCLQKSALIRPKTSFKKSRADTSRVLGERSRQPACAQP